MYILNTTYKIQVAIHKNWLAHLAEKHLPSILNTKAISNYKVHHVLVDEDDGLTIAVQLYFKDEAALKHFEDQLKPDLDQALWNQFPNQFVYFTTRIKELTS